MKRSLQVLLACLLLGLAMPLSAAVMDLSNYPDETPLSEVDIPGFSFVVTPGVNALVRFGQVWVENPVPGVDLRILFDGAASSSYIFTDGYGSCQLGRDYVSWYLEGGLVEEFDTFIGGLGRCTARELTRDYTHDEIRLDVTEVGQANAIYVRALSYTEAEVPATVPVPVMPTWAILLLAGLIGLGATPAVRRRFNV